MSRIENHIILGDLEKGKEVEITVDGKKISAQEGEPILSALLAAGIKVQNISAKKHEPRGYFCGIGRCTNCVMTVNGDPNVRTCITPVEAGMVVETQDGLGKWEESK
ncbi:MAG: (2Fe-2S)-binding protein [Lachnospiraceae bacterium]|nr:(2Fe-2S)-binding protein [Lachnospiraceae bacterium]